MDTDVVPTSRAGSETDPALIAFQYPDAIIEGDDLLVLSRTAWNGAHSYHDANMITFYRVKGFCSRHLK